MGLKVALLIPAYNEERSIGTLLRNLDYDMKDVIVVDDGSKDKTGEIVKKQGAVLLKHEHNLGKGHAHQTGFKYVIAHNYDYVITLDGDGQHNPKEIPLFIKEIYKNKSDIIVGTRRYTIRKMPFVRLLTNLTTSFVVSFLAHQTIRDSQSGYRAISRKVLETVPLTTGKFQTESEILIKASRRGYRIANVPISIIYNEKSSKINPIVDTFRFILLGLRNIAWK